MVLTRRTALTGGLLLAAASRSRAQQQSVPGALVGPSSLTIAQSLQLAPRRNRLTKTIGSGLSARVGGGGNGAVGGLGAAPLTIMYAIPIEAPCYAVRLGFANPYGFAMAVVSASVWPSDSYSQCVAMQTADRASNTTGLGPTGGAPESIVYFDALGADSPIINGAGVLRGITLPGVPSNTGNANGPFTIAWSDFAPVTSIPRADGGTQHILFVYVTMSGPSFSADNANLRAFNLDPVARRGRYLYRGIAWNSGTDYADNPTGTGWKEDGDLFGPLFAVQYLTLNPGIQIVLDGDSLSAAPTTDGYSTPLHRAAWDLSTPARPIEVASMAWGGMTSATYVPMLQANAGALLPSVVALQPMSRNDGGTAANMQAILGKQLGLAAQFQSQFGTRALFNTPGCEPSFDGNSTAQAAFADMRARLAAAAAASGIGVIDAPSVLGQPGSPWDYQVQVPAISDDNTHPNSVGAELVVPLARAALQPFVGI